MKMLRFGKVVLLGSALVFGACSESTPTDDASSKGTAEDTSATDNDTGTTDEEESASTETAGTSSVSTLAISGDPLVNAYPEGLSVTAFPTEVADSELISATISVGLVEKIANKATLSLMGTDPGAGPAPSPPPGGGGGDACSTESNDRLWFDPVSRVYTNVASVFPDGGEATIPAIDPRNACAATSGGGMGETSESKFKPSQKTAIDKINEQQKLLSGESESCFGPDVLDALRFEADESDRCYEFDQGILNATSCGGEEACLVASSRNLIEESAAIVEAGLGLMQAVVCAAKKNGVEGLPKPGKSFDLTKEIEASKPNDPNAPTFKSVKMERIDSSDGNPVIRSTVVIETTGGKTSEYTLSHSPSAEKGNEEYSGVFSIKRDPMQQPEGDHQQGDMGAPSFNLQMQNIGPIPEELKPYGTVANNILGEMGKDVTSVQYSKSGTGTDERIKVEIRDARINSLHEPFDDEGLVNYNSGADLKDPASDSYGNFPWEANAYLSQVRYVLMDVNPLTSEGNIAFWRNPGGSWDESARGFIFEISYDDTTGTLKGCGIVGAALTQNESSVRQAILKDVDLDPTGTYTPQVCWKEPGGGGTQKPAYVMKQCFSQNSDGFYKIDTAETTSSQGFDLVKVADITIKPPKRGDIKAPPVFTPTVQ